MTQSPRERTGEQIPSSRGMESDRTRSDEATTSDINKSDIEYDPDKVFVPPIRSEISVGSPNSLGFSRYMIQTVNAHNLTRAKLIEALDEIRRLRGAMEEFRRDPKVPSRSTSLLDTAQPHQNISPAGDDLPQLLGDESLAAFDQDEEFAPAGHDDDTVGPSEQGDGSASPEQGDGSASPEQGDGSASPEQGDGSASPEQDDGSASPEQDDGSASPEQDDGSASPEQDDGSASPEQDDDEDRVNYSVYEQTDEGEIVRMQNVPGDAMDIAVKRVAIELVNGMASLREKCPHKVPDGSVSWVEYGVRTTGCILRFVRNMGTVFAMTKKDFVTCRNCFNLQVPCLRYHDSLGYYVVPLPAMLRKGIASTDMRYFVYDEARASRRVERASAIWE